MLERAKGTPGGICFGWVAVMETSGCCGRGGLRLIVVHVCTWIYCLREGERERVGMNTHVIHKARS